MYILWGLVYFLKYIDWYLKWLDAITVALKTEAQILGYTLQLFILTNYVPCIIIGGSGSLLRQGKLKLLLKGNTNCICCDYWTLRKPKNQNEGFWFERSFHQKEPIRKFHASMVITDDSIIVVLDVTQVYGEHFSHKGTLTQEWEATKLKMCYGMLIISHHQYSADNINTNSSHEIRLGITTIAESITDFLLNFSSTSSTFQTSTPTRSPPVSYSTLQTNPDQMSSAESIQLIICLHYLKLHIFLRNSNRNPAFQFYLL